MLAAEKGLNVSQGGVGRKCIDGGEEPQIHTKIYRADFNRVIGLVFVIEMKHGRSPRHFFSRTYKLSDKKGLKGEIQSWQKRIRDSQKPST
jgi:hypothetical protein